METAQGSRKTFITNLLLVALLPLLWPLCLSATDGHFLHGAGPVNEAMGGADTGICLDATGSIAWNPACTTHFQGKRLEFHGTVFVPWRDLSSSVSAGAFGEGVPAETLQGTTVSHRNTAFMPGMGFVYHPQNSRNSFHFAILAVSGFGVDYDQNMDFSNPILTAQPPNGFGFGKIRSNYALLTGPIGVSRQVTDKLSVGISVVPSFSMLKVIPAPFQAPVSAGSTMPYYLSASTNAKAFGIGAQVGLQYQFNHIFSAGLAYHSPIWFNEFNWKSADLTGGMHTLKFQMDLPQLITMGIGISPTKRTHIGVDARWFNYANTSGFTEAGFDPDDAVSGFGWRNIWAAGGGVEQQVSSTTKLIVGYNYSQNPLPSEYTFLNTPAPAIVQHHLSGGIVQKIHNGWDLNITYYHAFRNSLTGPWLSMQGPIAGTSVTSRMSENSVTVGLAKSF
ncbi:MAG: OmpP1/FadL family transporter [Acidobacteriaceae bacterium]